MVNKRVQAAPYRAPGPRAKLGIAMLLSVLLGACGGGAGDAGQTLSVSIDVPTAAATYPTVWTDIRLGGTISGAGFVRVTNDLTGLVTEGYVNYYQGQGSWFADVTGLGFGENPLTVTADADGTGSAIANARITVIRPLQPADLIHNGIAQPAAATLWTDAASFNESHRIAIFSDGTGRATTGSALAENAAPPR